MTPMLSISIWTQVLIELAAVAVSLMGAAYGFTGLTSSMQCSGVVGTTYFPFA